MAARGTGYLAPSDHPPQDVVANSWTPNPVLPMVIDRGAGYLPVPGGSGVLGVDSEPVVPTTGQIWPRST